MVAPYAGRSPTEQLGGGQIEHPTADYHAPQYGQAPRPAMNQNTYAQITPNDANNSSSQLRNLPMDLNDRPLGTPQHRDREARDGSGRERALSPDTEQGRRSGSRRPSGSKLCAHCQGNLSGQFVRALGETYHLECFTCHDCGKIVASKFFPVPDHGPNQYPLCETDYFRRLELLCVQCGGALRGSYITALDKKYHIDHFTCSICPTVFGAQDSYYEHDGQVYCHYHYSTKFAQRCNGCQNPILKQFVEIFRNGQNQHWHPECYMIHKYWNVKLYSYGTPVRELNNMSEEEATDEIRKTVREDEENIEQKVLWIWRTLSSFEEKSATCISDMLVHVSNGAYMEGIMCAKHFILFVDLHFQAIDDLDRLSLERLKKGISYQREAKLLCKKVVAFFALLAESTDTGVRRLGVTQELLTLVTGLAHYMKLLIRISLQGALRLERETGAQDGLNRFLELINSLDEKLMAQETWETQQSSYVPRTADHCLVCDLPVEDKCFKKRDRVVHVNCMNCKSCNRALAEIYGDARWSQSSKRLLCRNCAMQSPDAEGGFVPVTKLQQYIHLLKVAHVRLLATLRTSGTLPHTSDDPNLADYNSTHGHRISPTGQEIEPPLLRSNTRSKSYGGPTGDDGQSGQASSYEQTLGDIRRLRSTRLDKHLSNTMKRARSSRIIEAPEGQRPGSAGEGASRKSVGGLQIIQDREANADSQLTFGVNALALDDIPRLVAAEQAKDQRPNASRYARGQLVGSEPKAKLVNGHVRSMSGGQELENMAAGFDPNMRRRKYFSELSGLEYFIVRHIAVLSMEPLLEGHFNQEQLLELIETKRTTFWDRFGKAFKNDKNKGGKGKKKVFGQPLDYVVEKDGADSTDGVGPGSLRVPAIVQDSVSAMRNMDMSVEGVFRKNGNIRRLRELMEEIDTKGCDAVELSREGPVQVAALLKKFLRELPDPVLTHKLHRLFIVAAKIPDDDKRRRVLHLTYCLLPKVNRDTMEVLCCFLNWVSSFHTVDEETGNKMDIHNLATVFAPNVLYPNSKNPEVDSSFLAIEAVNCLIECNEAMSEVPEDLLSILNDSTLFALPQDVTTKEILKRYGDIAKAPAPARTDHQVVHPGGAYSPGMSSGRGDNRNPIPAVRTDTDPNMWHNEASVRHVGGPQGGLESPYPPYASHGTPRGSQEGVNGSPGGHRNSGFRGPNGGFGQKQGALGITGAG